ncbi:Trm112 family protein [Pseudonocardia kujensis]|uniref:Trm112 family protein n=1 Tax=Pseudonocardia kujensis TaxID=1128675 RepID=UPI001E34C637|nr:Trm112 family protein [Pseudonocardia kujensis]MCE0768269.1 Trm112 family protein [Pseudonocardia kujensis]
MAVQLDPQLLEILACPSEDHAPLTQAGDELVCTACGRRYPVVDGIPVLLLDEALPAEDTPAPENPGNPG